MKCNTLNIVARKIKVALLGFGSWHNKKKKKRYSIEYFLILHINFTQYLVNIL